MAKTQSPAADHGLPSIADDPVLAALGQAEQAYRAMRAEAERLAAALAGARGQLADAYKTNRQLDRDLDASRDELAASKDQLELARARAERDRERALQLATALKDIHRAIFGGNIYDLLLRACLTLTGATRGLYITARGEGRRLSIRAAIDIDGYPQSPPSEFIQALCQRVLDDKDSLVCNSEADAADLPKPSREGERFHNFVAAPVVLLKDLDGIVIAADKMNGDFDEEDVEALVSVGDQAAVALENNRLRRGLQEAYLATITALADAVEAKDAYTAGHCERVARYAHRIAEELELSPRDRSIAFCAGLMHDVGKIGVSDGLLNKPGALLPEERELVRSHVRIGHDLVQRVPVLTSIADAVLRHHEWYDGTGYPDGLQGDEIPFTARVVSVADAYSAMIDKRSYKEAYSEERARGELERCAGSQFDPKVVEAFLRVLDQPDFDEDEDPRDVGYAPLLGLPATAEAR